MSLRKHPNECAGLQATLERTLHPRSPPFGSPSHPSLSGAVWGFALRLDLLLDQTTDYLT